jgi:hypothetical protein
MLDILMPTLVQVSSGQESSLYNDDDASGEIFCSMPSAEAA